MRGQRTRLFVVTGTATVLGGLAVATLILATPPAHGSFVAPPVNAPVTVVSGALDVAASTITRPQVIIPTASTTWSILVTNHGTVTANQLVLAVTTPSSLANDVTVTVTSCPATVQGTCNGATSADGIYSLPQLANPIPIANVPGTTLVTLTLTLDASTPSVATGTTLPLTAQVTGVAE